MSVCGILCNFWYLLLCMCLVCKYVFKIVYLLVYRFCVMLFFLHSSVPISTRARSLSLSLISLSLFALNSGAFPSIHSLPLLSVHEKFIDVKTFKAHQLYDIFIIFPSFSSSWLFFRFFSLILWLPSIKIGPSLSSSLIRMLPLNLDILVFFPSFFFHHRFFHKWYLFCV